MEDREPIKVYIKINENNEVTDINSMFFIDDLTGWILIDEGYGDRYAHAQNLYLRKILLGDDGKYNYKYENGIISELKP